MYRPLESGYKSLEVSSGQGSYVDISAYKLEGGGYIDDKKSIFRYIVCDSREHFFGKV